jgi:hypothetical protein
MCQQFQQLQNISVNIFILTNLLLTSDDSLTTQAPPDAINERTEVLYGEQNVVNTVLNRFE